MTSGTPVACNLDALSASERQRRSRLAASICDRVVDMAETDGGYRLRLSPDPDLLRDTLDLICLERRCCPFLEMKLVFGSGDGAVFFDIGGSAEVKAFLVSSGVLGCAG